MSIRIPCIAILLLAVTLPAVPAIAQSPAQSFAYRQKRFQHACRPSLKFAAGACVRRCPAGYWDTGGYCRFQSQRFR